MAKRDQYKQPAVIISCSIHAIIICSMLLQTLHFTKKDQLVPKGRSIDIGIVRLNNLKPAKTKPDLKLTRDTPVNVIKKRAIDTSRAKQADKNLATATKVTLKKQKVLVHEAPLIKKTKTVIPAKKVTPVPSGHDKRAKNHGSIGVKDIALAKTKQEALKQAKEKKRQENERAQAMEKKRKAIMEKQKQQALAKKKAEALRQQAIITKQQEQDAKDLSLAGTIIQDHIKQYSSFPEGHASDQKTQLELWLKEDGMVQNVKVVKSSGSPILDRSAINAVYRSQPIPLSKKKHIRKESLNIRLSISSKKQT